jgi:hypothetical protein
MNLEKVLAAFMSGVIGIAVLTTILGRSNTSRVLDSAGNAGSKLITSALGAGAGIR